MTAQTGGRFFDRAGLEVPSPLPFSRRTYKKTGQRKIIRESSAFPLEIKDSSDFVTGSPGGPLPAEAAGTRAETSRAASMAARAWARSQGMDIADTGRLLASVRTAWQAAGSPVIPAARCGQPGCHRVATHTAAPPLCSRCYQFRRHAATTERCPSAFGPPSLYVCNECPDQASQWALLTDAHVLADDRDRLGSADAGTYRPMCRACHSRLARLVRAARHHLAELAHEFLEGMPRPVVPQVVPRPLRHYSEVQP